MRRTFEGGKRCGNGDVEEKANSKFLVIIRRRGGRKKHKKGRTGKRRCVGEIEGVLEGKEGKKWGLGNRWRLTHTIMNQQVAQGQCVVSDTRRPALSGCVFE